MKRQQKQTQYNSQIKQSFHNPHQQKSFRPRNDHSIQAKSPLKIPLISIKKDDLTFRNKAQQSRLPINQFVSDTVSQTTTTPIYQNPIKKQSIKLNLQSLKHKKTNTICINQLQYQLIHKMWEICNKLTIQNNKHIIKYVENIQCQISKILTLITQQNLQVQAPLASSKKINLQNCIAYSHCQKQINHKQFQSQYSESFSLDLQVSRKQEQQIYKDISQPPLSTKMTPKDYQTTAHQLQMKKIMYMLDGKQKNQNQRKGRNHVDQVASDRISSLSSFNQNSCDDSGFTVFQIQRYSDHQRISKSSIIQHQISSIRKQINNENNFKKSMFKQTIVQRLSTGQKQNKRDNSSDMFQSRVSNQNSVESLKNNMSVGTKRKVLNDIVTMLNLKYNKNIRLQ